MELLDLVFALLVANVTSALLFSVVYLNVLLFRDYVWTLLWSFVISQALYSSKTRLVRTMMTLSKEDETRPVLSLLLDMVTQAYRRMHLEGKPFHAMLFGSILDWCIELFALVGLISLTSRLLSAWLLVAMVLAVLPFLGILYILDRRIFAYRAVVSDDVLASVIVISTFFASICFIGLFLGLESVHEGISAGQGASAWVQSMLDDEANEKQWSKHIAHLTHFAQETALGLESRYNDTVWFPIVHDTLKHYMEHGPVMMGVDSPKDGSSAMMAVTGFMSAEGLSDLLGTVREHVSNLDISMEHVINYGGPGGKVIANGAMYVAALGSFLVSVGFKVVLFFTCVLYMTSHDDFLERTVGDLLPISKKDRQVAVDMLRGAVQGVFFLPCKVACLHGVVTLFSFTLLNVEFPFFAAFVAVVVSILPVVPAYVVCWPWAVLLVLQGRWVGILLAVSQHLILSAVDKELCTQGIREANPYLTGLSSFLGFAVFGAQGVLVGPLIICLATFIYGGLGFLEISTASRQNISNGWSMSEVASASTDTSKVPSGVDSGGEGPKTSISSNLLREDDGKGERDTTDGYVGTVDPIATVRQQETDTFPLTSGELWRGFARALRQTQHSSRRGSATGDGRLPRLVRHQSDSQVDAVARERHFVDDDGGNLEATNFVKCDGRIRVFLRMKAPRLASANKDRGNSEEQNAPQSISNTLGHADSVPPAVDSMWRFDIEPTSTWDAFLHQIQDVTGVVGISGVYDKDGSRLGRVSFIDNGEILDVHPIKEPSNL